jgi:hypothetical protein
MQSTTQSEVLEQIHAAQRQWGEGSLQRASQQALQFTTHSDLPIASLVTPSDWSKDLYLSHSPFAIANFPKLNFQEIG